MKQFIAILLAALFLQACVPAMIIGAAYNDSKTRESRQAFTSSFHKTNMERESKKLPPLDWCSEVLRFDRQWYKKQKECPQAVFKKASDPN